MNALFAFLLFAPLESGAIARPFASGTVVDSKGEPAAGAEVRFHAFFENGAYSGGILVGRDGTFSIRPTTLSGKTYENFASGEWWAEREGEVSPVSTMTTAGTLQLQPISRLEVRLSGATSASLTVMTSSPMSTVWNPERWWLAVAQAGSKYDCYVPSGFLAIEAKSGSLSARSTIRVEPGKTAVLEVPLGLPGSVEVTVIDPKTETPWPHEVKLSLFPGRALEHDRWAKAVFRPGAPALLTDLMSGDQEVTLMSEDGRRGVGVIHVEPGRKVARSLRMIESAPSGEVGITLADLNGAITVTHVFPESAASRAGIQIGDAISRVGGTIPASATEAMSLLNGKPGTTILAEVVTGAARRRVGLYRAR